MHSLVVNEPDVRSSVREIVSVLQRLDVNLDGHTLVTVDNHLALHTKLQALFNLRFRTPAERTIYDIILTHAIAAERRSPGAFIECTRMLLKKLDLNDGCCTTRGDLELSCLHSSSGIPVPDVQGLESVLDEHCRHMNAQTRSMLLKSLELAGFAGRIIIEKTERSPSIELSTGYTFDQAPCWAINTKVDNPYVVCIDGYVETTSELNRLFMDAAASKDVIVLFVRGLSEDVKNTIKVNYDRGTLRIIPVIVKFDIEGINAINDISIASGVELVSSTKGDLITNVCLSSARQVDSIIVHPNKVVINNRSSRCAVAAHIDFLRSKRSAEKVVDVSDLFDRRIRSLSPNYVVIRLKNDKEYVITSQALDYALRAVTSYVDRGAVIVAGKHMLVSTVVAATTHSQWCFESLKSLTTLISQDPSERRDRQALKPTDSRL